MRPYIQCCGLYIDHREPPKTPEALMRSRYTAYSLANIAYFKATMHGKALIHFDEVEAENWARSVQWLNLKVVKTQMHLTDEHIGYVEFIATFIDKKTVKQIHENSRFHQIDDRWLYVDGENNIQNQPSSLKYSRNAPCPCGSNKKFKNCHG